MAHCLPRHCHCATAAGKMSLRSYWPRRIKSSSVMSAFWLAKPAYWVVVMRIVGGPGGHRRLDLVEVAAADNLVDLDPRELCLEQLDLFAAQVQPALWAALDACASTSLPHHRRL